MKALEVEGIRECIALYADNMLIVSSLEAVFEILGTFANFLGLRVNWEKDNVMAIDNGAQARAMRLVPIAWVSELKYLGIRISPKVGEYLSLNLMPLLT